MSYYITFNRTDLNSYCSECYYIDYEGKASNNYDNCMEFDSEEKAKNWIEENKKDFYGNVNFSITPIIPF